MRGSAPRGTEQRPKPGTPFEGEKQLATGPQGRHWGSGPQPSPSLGRDAFENLMRAINHPHPKG